MNNMTMDVRCVWLLVLTGLVGYGCTGDVSTNGSDAALDDGNPSGNDQDSDHGGDDVVDASEEFDTLADESQFADEVDGGESGWGDESAIDTDGTASSSAAQIAVKLGRSAQFLIGMGNDLADDHNQDGAYTLGTTLDLHYCYLVGLKGQGGWPDWNADGSFINILTDSAQAHGVVPMFTLYSMAAWGEANLSTLANDSYMQPYWDGAKLLFQRLAIFDQPAVVHFEPDFWGFAQTQASNGDPTSIPVHVKNLISECSSLSNDLTGMGRCLVRLARTLSPKVVIGFHASRWAATTPDEVATFLNKIGGAEADIVVVEALDRDAGCFEAHVDPNCQRDDGPWYWDESNQTSPNFHEHLAWVQTVSASLGKPVLWWQLPFGVPSDQPGGSAGQYRDNRVRYLFSHVLEFVQAGGLGAVFGTGAGNQTYINSDGNQFSNAVESYFLAPVALP